MSEQHHHPKPGEIEHPHGVRGSERRRLLAVTILTGVVMVAEFIGGVFADSLALINDAIHTLTHFAAIGLSLAAIVIATRPAPPDKTYRYWRAEVIASFISGLAFIPVAGIVLYEAWGRWQNPKEVKVITMLGVGAIGLIVNIVSALFLHRHSKEDLNIRGAFLHMVADSAAGIGVLVAGGLIYFFGWKKSDPLIAAFISLLILIWAVGLVRDSIRILLESVPKHLDLERIRKRMLEESGVSEVHDLHVWTITSKMYALTAHVILKEDGPVSTTEDLAHRLECLLDETYDINHVTLQFETRHKAAECAHEHAPSSGHMHEH